MLQADRGAVAPDEAKALITEVWRRTDSGQAFRLALEEKGWLLARGDRRDFVVVDPQCGTHSLARRVEGAKAKDIRARMADVDPESLPSVAEARTLQRQRPHEPPPERSFESVQIDHMLADAEGKRTMALKQLEQADRKDARRLRNNPAAPPTPERAFGDAAREQAQDIRNQRHEDQFWAKQKAWRVGVNEHNPDKAKPAEKGLQVVDSATGSLSKLGEFVLNFLSGPSAPRPEKPADMKAFVTDPAARKEQQLARLAARQSAEYAEQAMESIRQDMQAGRNLKSEDIKRLSHQHLEQIRQFGDSAVHQMVDEARKRSEEYWKGDERER